MSDHQTVEPRIVERLRKLLALAKDNANENEANAAMAKAQELMAEYNVELAVLEASGSSSDDPGAARENSKSVGRAMYEYQRKLMHAIADANHCFVWDTTYSDVQKSKTIRRQGYHLLGRKSNIISTTTMFDYLNATLERLVPIESYQQRLSRSAISWKEGASQRLVERFNVRRREAELARQAAAKAAQPTPSYTGNTKTVNALVVAAAMTSTEYDLNCDFLYGDEPGTAARKRVEREAQPVKAAEPQKEETAAEKAKREKANKRWYEKWDRQQRAYWNRRDISAYDAGRVEGDKISLDTQVAHDPLKAIS